MHSLDIIFPSGECCFGWVEPVWQPYSRCLVFFILRRCCWAMPEESGSKRGNPAVFTLCLAQYFLSGLLHLPVLAYYGISPGYALLASVGGILYICISLDSMIRTLMGQGVSWKLRQYGKPPL